MLVSRKPSSTSVDEMQFAEIEILKHVQMQSFGEELSCLKKEKSEVNPKISDPNMSSSYVTKKSTLIIKLDPELRHALLCVGGRLKSKALEEGQKDPVILPNKHHLVDLIVRHHHLLSGHSGQQSTFFHQ